MGEGNQANPNLEAWKQTIEVQQHFNNIQLQIRNYAVTLLAALFGVVAYALKEEVAYGLTLAVLGAALVLCYAFYFMDRHWYHRFLVGAVKHGTFIEDRSPPEMGLTKAISAESAFTWWGGVELHAKDKILVFYWMLAAPIIVLGVVILCWAPHAASVSRAPDQSTRGAGLSTQSRPEQSGGALKPHQAGSALVVPTRPAASDTPKNK
jgi:hypothetical protein